MNNAAIISKSKNTDGIMSIAFKNLYEGRCEKLLLHTLNLT